MRTKRQKNEPLNSVSLRLLLTLALLLIFVAPVAAQDKVIVIGGTGTERIRIAAANFKLGSNDALAPALQTTFDTTLYSDLANAGIFDLVSKSLIPTSTPGSPQEIRLAEWAADPAKAAMVAFGNLSVAGTHVTVRGWLFDTANHETPQVIGKQYNDVATQDAIRLIAHKFADEIIFRLGGGINGIAETHIYFVSSRTGSKEIWVMDYDGQNQHILTHLGTVAMSPRISPDNSRVAFAGLDGRGWAVRMYSVDLGRLIAFPAGAVGSLNQSPAWSADGKSIAFSSSRGGNPDIWVADANGGNARRITSFPQSDVSPTWNPRTNSQIAWVSDRSGMPQIYTMDADGSNIQRMTDSGYATSPGWSPNGQFLTFAWDRKYGPGAPGGRDIYVMDIASKRWLQLTHDSGNNDFPCWAPDGRHIVFERKTGGRTDLWTMLADGTEQHEITHSGNNFMPNWSWK